MLSLNFLRILLVIFVSISAFESYLLRSVSPKQIHAHVFSDTSGDYFLDSLTNWLKKESLSSLITKDEASTLVREFFSNSSLDKYSSLIRDYFVVVNEELLSEKRSLKEIIGLENSKKILTFIESIDIYDPDLVRSFLRSPPMERMMGNVLYEAIFEFIQKVDILGNILNNLPIIGPIRQQIVREFKKNLDVTIGGQIKTFLVTFNRVAVQRMAEFVLSPENKKSFLNSNRNVIDLLLSRPLKTLLPESSVSLKFYDDSYRALKNVNIVELTLLDKIYDYADGNGLEILVEGLDPILENVPTAKRVLQRNFERFVGSAEGEALVSSLRK